MKVDGKGERSELVEEETRNGHRTHYFYPKDDSPGCTKEACSFRDRMEDYQREGIGVYGVSIDSPESHRQFREKYRLNFPLLTDEGGEAAAELGVLNDRGHAKRTTFLLGAEGKIEQFSLEQKEVWSARTSDRSVSK